MLRNRVKAFTGPRAEERAERVGHFFKALAGIDASRKWNVDHHIALEKATREGTNSAGGFLAPEDFDNAIIAVRDTVGAFRNAEVRRARSMNQVRPRRVGGFTFNFVPEGTAIPESQLEWDAVGATLKKLGALMRSSTELFEDSAADLGEYIATEAGYGLAAKEDDCGFNGDGTSTYSGISGLGTKLVGSLSAVNAASGHGTYLTLDTTDIGSLMAGVLATAIPGAKWYISAIGYAQTFCRIAASGGGLDARMNPDGSISANYLGFPVVFSSKLQNVTTSLTGKPMIFFGNLEMSSLIVEQQSGTIIATSYERSLDTDQVLVRATRREDIINHSVGDSASYGPIAMLVGG
jgi:HK97 family phage major capsid protein